MKIIQTDEVVPSSLDAMDREWCYNGMDCIITAEVLEVTLPQLDERTAATYNFSRAMQGPVLEMRLRGVRVDQRRKNEVIEDFYEKIDFLERNLERIVFDGVGMIGFNWRSNKDLQVLFYEKLGIPVIRRGNRPTVNRDALEKMQNYIIALPIINHLIAMRELGKKIGVLRTEIDPDDRIRTSYNIAGTNTGRLSSSFSEFGTGTNLQNIEESLRSIFIPDEGMKFAKFDAKSGESYCVGAKEWNLFKDGKYLDAVESGDIHTYVAKLCWPELAWTGDLKKDKDLAESPFYRHYTYRFMCKKLGHGSNYDGQPQTLSEQAKLPLPMVREFQPKYFTAFPAHLRWHAWVDNQIRKTGTIVSLMGRKRQFWGRRNDPKILREAIAYDPQGSLADIVNTAMIHTWQQRTAILMMNDHDALTYQYPEEQEDEIIPKIMKQLEVPVQLRNDRTLLIPYDCKVGWNKGEYDEKENPYGLKEYTGHESRTAPEEISILDRSVNRRKKKMRKLD